MLLHSLEQQLLQSLHPSHRKSMRFVVPLLLLLALGQFIAWLMPVSEELRGISGYLPLHTLFETVAVVIAMLVFAVSWNAHDRNQSGNLVLLGCVFFAVGWLDFSHILSYKGMPDFVTPSDPEKGLNFWLAARFLASVALLAAAIRGWRPFASSWTRNLLLGSAFIIVIVVNWVVLYHQDELPHTFTPGQGLTPLKIYLEYFFITLNLLTALVLWKKMRQPLPFNAALLLGAVVAMAMSEFFFTLYATMTDIFNVLGHTYKVIAYLMLYRAIVVEAIEDPYHKLHQAQQHLELSIAASNIGLWEWNIINNTVRFSREWKAQLGYLPDELPDEFQSWEFRIHPDDRAPTLKRLNDFLASAERIYENEFRLRHRDGGYRWILVRGEKQFNRGGTLVRLIGSHIDITQRKLAETALQASEARLLEAQRIAHMGNWELDLVEDKLTWSDEIFRLLEISRSEFGANYEAFLRAIHPDDRNAVNTVFTRSLETREPYEITHRLQMADGRIKWVVERCNTVFGPDGKPTKSVGVIQDVTALKRAEEEIRDLAFFDPLTGLPNRRLLINRLNLALSVSERSRNYGALLFIDMDKFKMINDTLGHDIGDLLLVEAAARIKSYVREADTVSRLGGDEFVVLLEEIDAHLETATQKTALIAEKIRSVLTEPYQLRDHLQHSSPSIGVSLYLGTARSVDELLKSADIAMYQAKGAGRNVVRFFDPTMQHAVEAHAALEADLRHAVPEGELHLYYQIQMDSDRHPLGAEALIRWIHPTRGMVSPMQFIPLAEESSLIIEIGDWVLDTACRQLSAWAKQEHTAHLLIAVNVSAQQFKQSDFVEKVSAVLGKHQVKPERLKLELTESVVLEDIKGVVAKMHALKMLGVKLSMDDFGTGYSSLSYLKQLPLNQIKIDQSFVRDMLADPNDAVMVRTIIGMANNFRLNVIAEGVETEAQLKFLMQLGCMAYQGYYFSKPVPVAELEAMLKID